jgi:hypothetical protein
MSPSQLDERFVIPVGRDFAPRGKSRIKYGYTALDEVAVEHLLTNGLERTVSILTTHSMVDFDAINENDQIYLGNPLYNLRIPCTLSKAEGLETLHRPVLNNFYKISEKLWQSFRPNLFMGTTPEGVNPYWYYQSTELRMLMLTLQVSVGSEQFHSVGSIFQDSEINTLPIHLYHHWSYKPTKEEMIDGVNYIEEANTEVPVVNVWKDFIVVTRHAEPDKVTLGVASDFHFSQRNARIGEEYPDSAQINENINGFAKKALGLWKEGKLDYLILNGDFIDYENISNLFAEPEENKPYGATNWRGLEQIARLLPDVPGGVRFLFSYMRILPLPFPVLKLFRFVDTGLLSNIPVIWNLGDHDRLKTIYSLPTGNLGIVGYNGAESHYNFNGLDTDEGPQFNVSSYQTGEKASHVSALRWIYERGRQEDWPLRATFRLGGRNFKIFCLDTRWMKGELTIDPADYPNQYVTHWPPPIDPLSCKGIEQQSLDALNDVREDDFVIVLTHAPPVCLAPGDARLGGEETSEVHSDECNYGVFVDNRNTFLQYLSETVGNGRVILVVSSHVHFSSAYFFENIDTVKVGRPVWREIAELNDPTWEGTSPESFWGRNPCLLLTTPPIGPKPNLVGQSSGFLTLQLDARGVARISFENLED